MLRLSVDPRRPDPATLTRLAAIVRDGGVVAIPTDTLYGLAADPFNTTAVQRLFAVKRRPPERAVPLVAADLAQVGETLGALPSDGVRLARRFWPGPLTLLMHASDRLANEVTGGLTTVGVRVPAHPTTQAFARVCGHPLTATSANISGADPSADPEEVARQLGDVLDALLDAGPTPGGLPSTIVDVSSERSTLVRAGAVPWEAIEECLRE